MEDGNEDAGQSEAHDKAAEAEENAAKLDDGEDAVLEEDAAVSLVLALWFLAFVDMLYVKMGERGGAYMEYLTDEMAIA